MNEQPIWNVSLNPESNYANYTTYEYVDYFDIPVYRKIISLYIKPTVISIGIISNILMFLLIVNCKLKKLAPMVYVAGIALTDAGFLLFSFFPWMEHYFYLKIYHLVGMCQLINYSMKSFTFLSRWYIAAFATERFIWEFLPEKRLELCSAFRTKLMLLSIAVLAIYGHVYICWFSEVSEDTKNICSIHTKNLSTFNTVLRIDMVFAYMLPYGLVIVISVIIALRKIRCKRTLADTETRPVRTLRQSGRLQIVDNREDKVRHLHATGIFLCYTLSLVLLTVPLTTRDFFGVMFTTFFMPMSWAEILSSLLDLHFASKPFICILVSPKIRHCGKRLIGRVCCKATNNKIKGPNTNSINLQDFNIEDSSEGTLIAVV